MDLYKVQNKAEIKTHKKTTLLQKDGVKKDKMTTLHLLYTQQVWSSLLVIFFYRYSIAG